MNIDLNQLRQILIKPHNLIEISHILKLEPAEAYISLHQLVKNGLVQIVTPTPTKEIYYINP